MDVLDELESKSIFIIREAYCQYNSLAVLWSLGKDSTVLMWLCRKAFYGDLPFPAIHIDTTYKIKSMYAFRDEYAKKWDLDLIVSKNEDALANGMSPDKDQLDCCTQLTTVALKHT